MSIVSEYRPVSDWGRRHFRSGKAEGRVEGKAEGKAEALLEILSARGLDVPDEVRGRITGCTDSDQIQVWIGRAVTADRAGDIFDD